MWFREVVKDIEDAEGDERFGARTVPVIWGTNAAKGVASSFIFTAIGLLVYAAIQLDDSVRMMNIVYMLMLVLFLITNQVLLFKATTRQQFAFISKLLKVTMVGGVCFMPFYCLIEF